jgi:aspartate ammonia-lyase
LAAGELDALVTVDALQGGAGTSMNMNVNEVLANRALAILGVAPGRYDRVSPHDDLNAYQSTNDTFPTALRVAAIRELRLLADELVALQEEFQRKEREFSGIVKVARTELQDAVLITLGRGMGAYAEAMNRDRWRLYKCEERLRVVNLGGTAVGTGLGAPREYIFRVVDELRALTGLGLCRAENLVEATQNADVFAEVSGLLKTCATNLAKICGDLRLLSSGPDAGLGELKLPPRQEGSSLMPGKVNPVIPETVTQAAMLVVGYDVAITWAVASGNLELNAFLPLVAHALLTSVGLLTRACRALRTRCVEGLAADADRCRMHVEGATALATALIPQIGHARASELAVESRATGRSVRELCLAKGWLGPDAINALLSPEAICRLGNPPPP